MPKEIPLRDAAREAASEASTLVSLFEDVVIFVKNHVAPPTIRLEYCKPKFLADLGAGEGGELNFDSFDINARFEVTDENGKHISPNPFQPGDTPQVKGPRQIIVHLITHGNPNMGAIGTAKLIKS